MFLAIVLLFGLLYLRKYCEDLHDTSIVQKVDTKALLVNKILVALTFLQVLMGTQVRQQVDHFMRDTQIATPETIISHLNWVFIIHRSFSLIIVGFFIYLLAYYQKQRFNRQAFFLTLMAFFGVLGNITTGIMLNYFDFPMTAQPPHLFFGVVTLSFLYSLSLNLRGTLLDH
jgi:cytochrome c oxidase assembly protein subunit 15